MAGFGLLGKDKKGSNGKDSSIICNSKSFVKNKHVGSTFDSFLEEEGILEECEFYGIERLHALRVTEHLRDIRKYIKSESKGQYLQGQSKCPICGSVVNYIWSSCNGFERYECSENDCLPYPDGGAMKRRLNGQEKIKPTRYRK